jgi:YfiH family protein
VVESAFALPILTAPGWHEIAHLEHGFFGRRGGASSGEFAELNLSRRVGDTPEAVSQNWQRVRSHVGHGFEFVTMNQVHGARVVEIASLATDPGEADAVISTIPRAGLCVLTADCVPILLVAPRAHLVAAVHAGWRGTVAGVARATVSRMIETSDLRPNDIRAALGPAIGSCCYEVDVSIVDDLESRWGRMPSAVRRYVRDGTTKARLDLRTANVRQLTDAGLNADAITVVGGCTSCHSSNHFSHRLASTVGGPGVTGRQLSFIGWSR